MIEAIRRAAEPELRDIDGVLERSGGRRLAPNVDVLGTVAIEATTPGLTEDAASDHIKAILEDQPISRVL